MLTINSSLGYLDNLLQSSAFRVFAALYLVGMLLEFLIPAERISFRDRKLNLLYSLIHVNYVFALHATKIYIVATLIRLVNVRGLIDISFGDGLLFSVLAVFFSTLVTDFFLYWWHRWQHSSMFLWQEHLFHHTDTHMNVTTSARVHILEQFLMPVFVAAPVAILFSLPKSEILVVALFPMIWGYVIHMNIRIGFGSLWWLVASPQYHRIHHSTDPKLSTKNLAVFFPIWDIVFGTAHRPKAGEYPRTGVEGIEVNGLTKAFLLPFIGWYRLARGLNHGSYVGT